MKKQYDAILKFTKPIPCTGHGCPHDRDNCPRYKLYLSRDERGRRAIESACAGTGGC
jgi:hypothetical protein